MSKVSKYELRYYSKTRHPAGKKSLEKDGYVVLDGDQSKKLMDVLIRMYPRDGSIQRLRSLYDEGSILFMYKKDIDTVCVFLKDVGVFLDIIETKLKNLYPRQTIR